MSGSVYAETHMDVRTTALRELQLALLRRRRTDTTRTVSLLSSQPKAYPARDDTVLQPVAYPWTAADPFRPVKAL